MENSKIKLDKFTFHTVFGAVFHCYMMEVGDVKKETCYSADIYKELDKKYKNQKDNFTIDKVDLPIIIKALEWMLIIRDESTLLDISKEQGMSLLQLTKDLLEGGIDKIEFKQWF